MNIPFYKCNANGNDFIIISHSDDLDYKLFTKEKIKSICNYGKDSSIDGFILLHNIDDLNKMSYFNNDGSWETFCLNGLVCCSLLLKKEFGKNNYEIISNNILYKTIIVEQDFAKVELIQPIYHKKNIIINNYKADYLNSGAKHLIINYEDNWGSEQELKEKMKKIRYHKLFRPNGINVNFYKIINANTIQVRTYEKGIESIVDSCSSGSYACAYDYYKKNAHLKKINVINDGGTSQVIFGDNCKIFFFNKRINRI